MDIQVFGSSSAGNCYRVTDGSTPLLLEAGIRFRDIQRHLNFSLSALAGCLVSHEHGDHAKAVKDLLKAGVDCYMSEGTRGALGVESHRIKVVTPKQQFTLGTWTILPFSTQHDAAEPLGFLLVSGKERLLFATDTYYVKHTFTGLTHIMLECNYAEDILADNVAAGRIPASMKKRLLTSHFSLRNVKSFLKANDLRLVEEIWLLHLSDGNSNAERFKHEIVAQTGKVVYVAE